MSELSEILKRLERIETKLDQLLNEKAGSRSEGEIAMGGTRREGLFMDTRMDASNEKSEFAVPGENLIEIDEYGALKLVDEKQKGEA